MAKHTMDLFQIILFLLIIIGGRTFQRKKEYLMLVFEIIYVLKDEQQQLKALFPLQLQMPTVYQCF